MKPKSPQLIAIYGENIAECKNIYHFCTRHPIVNLKNEYSFFTRLDSIPAGSLVVTKNFLSVPAGTDWEIIHLEFKTDLVIVWFQGNIVLAIPAEDKIFNFYSP